MIPPHGTKCALKCVKLDWFEVFSVVFAESGGINAPTLAQGKKQADAHVSQSERALAAERVKAQQASRHIDELQQQVQLCRTCVLAHQYLCNRGILGVWDLGVTGARVQCVQFRSRS